MQHNPMLSPRPQSSEHVQGSPSKKRRLLLWLPTSLKGLAGGGSTCVFTSYVAFNTLRSTSASLSVITCDRKPGYLPCRVVTGAKSVHIGKAPATGQLLENPEGCPALLLVQEKHQINTGPPEDVTCQAIPQNHGALESQSPDNVQYSSYEPRGLLGG